MVVYILECEPAYPEGPNSIYVGYTEDLEARLAMHFAGEGSIWTRNRKPIRIINSMPGQEEAERRETLRWMKEYGVQNVRGSEWCALFFTTFMLKELEALLYPESPGLLTDQSTVKCFKCGSSDHYRTGCKKRIDIYGHRIVGRFKLTKAKKASWWAEKGHFATTCDTPPPPLQCDRCGKDGHEADTCCVSLPSEPVKCERCGITGHSQNACYLPSPKVAKPKGKKKKAKAKAAATVECFRCGRFGHYATTCRNKTHVDGHYL